jgi:glyoxylase-like metal-dependent hydrolase (beta-lactamase superfamily II)
VAALISFKQAYVTLKSGKKAEKANNLKFRPYETRPGDILVSGDTALTELGVPLDAGILFTPGHTADSLSLLFPDGDCLCGDAAAHMLPFAGTHYCVIFVADLAAYYKSWDKLLQAGARRIFPAHGAPFPAARLAENRGKNREADIVPH